MLVITNGVLGNRKYIRVKKSIDILIDGRINGRTTNIGMGGLYATMSEEIEDFLDYKIELKLPEMMSIFLEGIPLRSLHIRGGCFHTAISFKENTISEEDKHLLNDFLEEKGNYVARR